jgi:hypothetical protein
MHDFYAACDKAYIADSDAFLNACQQNDTLSFFQLIGYSDEQIRQALNVIDVDAERYMQDYPNMDVEENECTSCTQNALPNIGTLESNTNGNLAITFDSNVSLPCMLLCRNECAPIPFKKARLACTAACIIICLLASR